MSLWSSAPKAPCTHSARRPLTFFFRALVVANGGPVFDAAVIREVSDLRAWGIRGREPAWASKTKGGAQGRTETPDHRTCVSECVLRPFWSPVGTGVARALRGSMAPTFTGATAVYARTTCRCWLRPGRRGLKQSHFSKQRKKKKKRLRCFTRRAPA